MSEALLYPHPGWVADIYECVNCGHCNERYRAAGSDDSDWKGVVRCRECGGGNTELIATNQPVKPKEFKVGGSVDHIPDSPSPLSERRPARAPAPTYTPTPTSTYADVFKEL